MSDIERIPPEEALDRMDDGWLYLDVRSIPEFEGGHPEGAYNIPLNHMERGEMLPNQKFLAVMEANFPKDAKIILGCRSGGRSLRAAQMMIDAGFTSVIDQRAGFSGSKNAFGGMEEAGWQPAGLPIAIEAEEGRDYASLEAKAK